MANDGTIASRLQLDGEKQYQKALNDAYRSLRVLKSELKAETAELGRNATAQDKARTKISSLQKQIAEQQKVVKTLEKALAASRKEYADNQEVQDKWAEKLNRARAALAEMENQLGTAEDSLKDFNSSMKDAAESGGTAATTVISFNDAMKSIGNIASGIGDGLSGIFNSTAETMREMVDEMFKLMSLAWSAAGEWQEIQTIWGGDLESIERVYRAMGLQGIDASEVTGGIQKFITNVHNGNKDTLAALQELGLTEGMFENHWDFFTAVMDEASQRGNTYDLATALFGDKKGAGATNLLRNWADAMSRYKKDIKDTGMELTSPEIEQLDTVAHKITEIQALWNDIKTNVGAKLSEVLNIDGISEDTLEILRDIGALISGEGDRKEIVFKLSQDIQSLLTKISEALENLSGFLKDLGGELEKSENPLVRFVGKLISSMGGILDWISENSDTIIDWLNKLLPVMAANKISEATTGKGIGDWLTDILKLGLEVKVLGKVFGTSAGTAIGGTAATFGAGIGAAIMKAVPALAFLGTLLNPDGTGFNGSPDTKHVGEFYDENGAPQQWAIDEGYLDQYGNITEKANPLGFRIGEKPIPEVEESVDLPEAIFTLSDKVEAIQDWWDAYRNAETGADTWDEENNAFDWMTEVLGDDFGSFWDRFLQESEGKDLTQMQDIPADWYASISDALRNLTTGSQGGEQMESLPARVGAAAEAGISKKPLQVTVMLDGSVMASYIDRQIGEQFASMFG